MFIHTLSFRFNSILEYESFSDSTNLMLFLGKASQKKSSGLQGFNTYVSSFPYMKSSDKPFILCINISMVFALNVGRNLDGINSS